MIVEPPGTRYYYPNRKEVILKCNIQDMSFLFSQLYNMILITICTVYAVKTRKIPENFNESKFIGFTMYTTCIIWLAFIPIYFGTGNSYEVRWLVHYSACMRGFLITFNLYVSRFKLQHSAYQST